jgi:catechol 2,3-dioxygenase-like lactoylglutathione lyase family enzyme
MPSGSFWHSGLAAQALGVGVGDVRNRWNFAIIAAVFDHVTLQVGDVATSRAFYEQLLAPLGIRPSFTDGDAVGFFGSGVGGFWITPAQGPETRELHLAFGVPDRAHVEAFFAAGSETGAEIIYKPQLFPQYHENYFAAFVRDPDGHSIEAVCHNPG